MVFIIALIFSLRVFGFMAILPIITSAAVDYHAYSTLLVGWVIGAYGLMQAILHIPMGFLSDKYGRRKIVLLGLFLMFAGSVYCALTSSIYGLIIGRALQGAGAIGSVLNAWCADLTAESNRTKSMALIGISIGATFLLAVVLGPVIYHVVGLSGFFWLTALLSVVAGLLTVFLPDGQQQPVLFKKHFVRVISESSLMKINFGVFALHFSYTALFLLIPAWVAGYVGGSQYAWHLYLPMILTAIFMVLPAMFFAEARGCLKQVLLVAASLLLFANVLFLIGHATWLSALFVYFSAFTLLESLLPSLMSKFAPEGHKGTAMGCFSCFQYAGILFGSVLGAWLLHHFGVLVLLSVISVISIIWFLFSSSLPVVVPKR